MYFVIQVINFGRHSANAMVPIFISSLQAKWWCQVFVLPDKRRCGWSYKYIVDFLLKSHCSVVVLKVFNYLLIHCYSLTASCCDSSENTTWNQLSHNGGLNNSRLAQYGGFEQLSTRLEKLPDKYWSTYNWTWLDYALIKAFIRILFAIKVSQSFWVNTLKAYLVCKNSNLPKE